MSRVQTTRRAKTRNVKVTTSVDNALAIPDSSVNGLNFSGDFTLEGNFMAESLASSFYIASKYSFATNERQYAIIYAASTSSINLNVSGDGTSATLKQFRLLADIKPLHPMSRLRTAQKMVKLL
jgi:hypothetical protein